MYISISLRRLFIVTKMSQRGPSTFCACNVTMWHVMRATPYSRCHGCHSVILYNQDCTVVSFLWLSQALNNRLYILVLLIWHLISLCISIPATVWSWTQEKMSNNAVTWISLLWVTGRLTTDGPLLCFARHPSNSDKTGYPLHCGYPTHPPPTLLLHLFWDGKIHRCTVG